MEKAGSEKLRVCIFLPKLRVGGAEVSVLQLVKNLDKSLFEISLCCLNNGDPAMEEEARRFVDSIYWIGFRWRYFPFAFGRLVRYLRIGQFDILHSHLPLADSIGRLAGWIAGVPVLVTTEHGRFAWKPWPYLVLERLLARITDMRICVSRDIMEIRRRREGTPPEKLEYIPNSVDPEAFRRPARGRVEVMAEFGLESADPLVVSVGRLVAAKNYPLLVEAISLLRERFPAIGCILVGDGDCRGVIHRRIESLDLAEHVKLAGIRSDIPDILAAADIFVLTSNREGLPVSIVEAMAAGKAIAATSVGGIPDAIDDGRNGLLVPPEDPQALADAVRALADDGKLRYRLGRAASEDADRRFSVRQTARQTGDVYLELAGKEKKVVRS